MALNHGGRLRAASARYGIALDDWLDLSTGIAPWSYPVPQVPGRVWARLPEADDGLIAAAADYYQAPEDEIVALPGSQFAIQALPKAVHTTRGPARIGVPAVGYTEHAQAWATAGHELVRYQDLAELEDIAATLNHALVIQPNNPTAEQADSETLAGLAGELARRDGLLLVDAAFADCNPGLDTSAWPANVLVLRSVGKFFGLAGVRLGFLIGRAPEVACLQAQLRPWGVSHPARWIGCHALADRDWQAAQQARIAAGAHALTTRLETVFSRQAVVSAGLFTSVLFDDDEQAGRIHAALAEQAIWTRLGDNGRWLRFGLPGNGAAQTRLGAALDAVAERGLC